MTVQTTTEDLDLLRLEAANARFGQVLSWLNEEEKAKVRAISAKVKAEEADHRAKGRPFNAADEFVKQVLLWARGEFSIGNEPLSLIFFTGIDARRAAEHSPKSVTMTTAEHEMAESFNTWMGVPIAQYPTDLLTYQNLIYETQPHTIVITGTLAGGLALYLSATMETFGIPGRIVSIDIDGTPWRNTLQRPLKIKPSLIERIDFIEASSTSPQVFEQVQKMAAGKSTMVILDSDHSGKHVLDELRLYWSLIQPGGYLLVNDTHLDETYMIRGPGPLAAVRDFLKENSAFRIASEKHNFMVSCMHCGILQRRP